MLCKCPLGTAIPTIPVDQCPTGFGQIQKVIFQRQFKSPGVKNFIHSDFIQITDKAAWTPFLTAADGSKMIISPYLHAPTTEPGAARTFGGGNETLGGIPIVLGREATAFTGFIRQIKQIRLKLWKQLECEEMAVWLIDENGNIGGINPDENDLFFPIPIRSLFFGDLTLGGFEGVDSNGVQWSFLPNWSDELSVIIPSNFNPLTDF